jgi:ribosomal protein S14
VSDHERRRKQVRDANRRMRARRKRGVYRRMLSIPGTQFRRLAELGYLKRVDNPAAQITALEAFFYDELQASS